MSARITGLAMLALVVGCAGEAAPGTSVPVATTMPSSATTTTASATTTVVDTTTTSFPPRDFDCPPVLVVADRVTAVDERCSVSEVTPGGVDQAMDDKGGGLLYQGEDSVIWHQAAAAPEPVPAIEARPEEAIGLEDVSGGGRSPQIWFSRLAGSTPEDTTQTLEWAVPGEPGTTVIGRIGGWEYHSSVTVGGEMFALEGWAEGFYGFHVAGPDLQPIDQAWNPFPDVDGDFVVCEDRCPFGLVISDAGDRVAFVEPFDQGPIILPVLVVVDLATGAETHRLEVSGLGWPGEPAEGPGIVGLDLLGDIVVVNGADDGQPFPAIWADLSDQSPVWEQFEVRGTARLLRSRLQVGTEKE